MLKQRIQILTDSGVIGTDTSEFLIKVIDLMAAEYPQIDTDHAAMFTTHLAMSVERIKKGEIVDMMDDLCWQQIAETPEFPMAQAFRDKVLPMSPIPFPESESRFILLHICSMLES